MTILASVYDIYLVRAGIGKYQKGVTQKIQLQARLFNIHWFIFDIFGFYLPNIIFIGHRLGLNVDSLRLGFGTAAAIFDFFFAFFDLLFKFIQGHIDGRVHIIGFFSAVKREPVSIDIDLGNMAEFFNRQDNVGFGWIVEQFVKPVQFFRNICF